MAFPEHRAEMKKIRTESSESHESTGVTKTGEQPRNKFLTQKAIDSLLASEEKKEDLTPTTRRSTGPPAIPQPLIRNLSSPFKEENSRIMVPVGGDDVHPPFEQHHAFDFAGQSLYDQFCALNSTCLA